MISLFIHLFSDFFSLFHFHILAIFLGYIFHQTFSIPTFYPFIWFFFSFFLLSIIWSTCFSLLDFHLLLIKLAHPACVIISPVSVSCPPPLSSNSLSVRASQSLGLLRISIPPWLLLSWSIYDHPILCGSFFWQMITALEGHAHVPFTLWWHGAHAAHVGGLVFSKLITLRIKLW